MSRAVDPSVADAPSVGPRLVVGRTAIPVEWRLAGFYGAAFLTIGVFMPFWPLWLTSRGLGPEEIGLVLALATTAKVIGSPLFAHIADRLGTRRPLMIALSLAALIAFVFYAAAEVLWTVALAAVLVGLTFPALMPLGENTTLVAARLRGFDYGRVRLWGSLTFVAASWGGGLWLAGRDEIVIPWLVIGSMAMVVAACTMLPDVRMPRARGAPAFRHLLGSGTFLLFLATAALIQSSHAAYYGFSTLHWRNAGISEATIGLLWAEGVLAEIALFLFAGRIVARVGIVPMFVLAAAATVVRWGLTAASSDLAVLVLVQGLHGATFGATHLAAMHFIQRAIPPSSSATAQALYSAIASGLVLALVMLATGALYAAFGGGAFLAMTAMGGLAVLFAFRLARVWDGGELSLEDDRRRR